MVLSSNDNFIVKHNLIDCQAFCVNIFDPCWIRLSGRLSRLYKALLVDQGSRKGKARLCSAWFAAEIRDAAEVKSG